MHRLDERRGPEGLHWALLPPGLPRLSARVDSLEEHLRLALTELRLLGDQTTWIMHEVEEALALALELLLDERTAIEAEPTPA